MRHFAEKNREIVTHNRYILIDKIQYVLHLAPWNSPYILKSAFVSHNKNRKHCFKNLIKIST